ncbi:MAG: hypothetical protein ACFFAJ_06565 [Candidatus Hodarchaeota archaeon]
MSYISSYLLKDFVICPRFFQFRWPEKLSLVPSTKTEFEQIVQERIDEFTFNFFSNLKPLWANINIFKGLSNVDYFLKSRFNMQLDAYIKEESQNYQELDEKVHTVLVWLVFQLLNKGNTKCKKKPFILPILINELIQVPKLRLSGNPSAVFLYPTGNALIFIQTYRPFYPYAKDIEILQASLCARILSDIGLIADRFLCVNYCNMSLIFRKFRQKDFDELDKSLTTIQSYIEEQEFIPPKSPPCTNCEFRILYKN